MVEPEQPSPALVMLRKGLFVRASDLLSNVVVATKNEDGKVTWINLGKEYHGMMLTTALTKKKTEAKSNRANRERKRLARKRQRAAARERRRECDKLKIPRDASGNPTGQTRKCDVCENRFASRKRLSKHKCAPIRKDGQKEVLLAEKVKKTNLAKAARRRKARAAKKERKKSAKVAEPERRRQSPTTHYQVVPR
ncbi:hypothetical protein BDZ91DRAFT_766534 [Kalaharituber pfeilii]|nr:hypothetical protein BDZ91DRAFT_766534 [Kalaharituber pfeilii]